MSDVGELRAALKRCHALLQDAEAWIDPDAHPAWSVAVTEELAPCDEAMECPAVLAPKPAPLIHRSDCQRVHLFKEDGETTDRIACSCEKPAPRGERRVRQEQPERYLAIDGEDRRTPAPRWRCG